MPKQTSKVAIDQVGRPTSKEAQAAYDAKGQSPNNWAKDKKVAQRAAKFVGDFISRSETARTLLNDKYAVLYALWNGDPITQYFPGARAIHVPEPFKAVEGVVPRISSVLIGQPGWFRVVGIDETGKKNAEKITKLLLAQLKRDQWASKARVFFRDCAIYGDAPGKVRWVTRRRKIRYNKVTETPVKQGDVTSGKKLEVSEAEEEVNNDGPTLEHSDIFDFFVDLRYRDIQDSPGVCFRYERFEDDLLAMEEQGSYINVQALIGDQKDQDPAKMVSGPPGTFLNPSTFRQIRDASDGLTLGPESTKPSIRIYEVFEFWGRFDRKYDMDRPGTPHGREEECVITLARRKSDGQGKQCGWYVLRVSENPYWHGLRPAVCAHYTRRSHCFQSVGIIEPIVKLCAELDDSRNMALAARSLEAKPILIAGDDADIYSNNLILDPGTVLRARNPDAIKPLFIPKGSDSAFRSEEIIKNDIRETTGIISSMQGGGGSDDTATEVVNRMKEANKRIAEVSQNIAEDFLIPMLEMFHSLDQQMITEERLVELVGEDGINMEYRKMGPAEIAGRVNFEITALPQIEAAGLEARMYLSFLTAAQPFLMLDPQVIRPKELLKMTWVRMFGTVGVDRVFPNADAPLELRTADDEHQIIGMGHMLQPQIGENYYAHLQSHKQFTTLPAFRSWGPDAQRRMLAHMESTKLKLNQSIEAALPNLPPQVAELQQMAQGGQPGGPQQPGAPGAPGGQQMPPRPGMPPQGGQPPGGMPRPGMPGMQMPSGRIPATTTGQVRSAAASIAPRTKKDGGF